MYKKVFQSKANRSLFSLSGGRGFKYGEVQVNKFERVWGGRKSLYGEGGGGPDVAVAAVRWLKL